MNEIVRMIDDFDMDVAIVIHTHVKGNTNHVLERTKC